MVVHTYGGAYIGWCIHRVVHTYGGAYIWWCIHMVVHTYGGAYIWWCTHMVVHTYGDRLRVLENMMLRKISDIYLMTADLASRNMVQ